MLAGADAESEAVTSTSTCWPGAAETLLDQLAPPSMETSIFMPATWPLACAARPATPANTAIRRFIVVSRAGRHGSPVSPEAGYWIVPRKQPGPPTTLLTTMPGSGD